MIGIILCTRECNLRCRYCFEEKNFRKCTVRPREEENRVFLSSLPVFESFGKQLYVHNQKKGIPTEFTFHGGEPLIIFPKNLKRLCDLLQAAAPGCIFNMQTNGTLLTDEALALVKEYRIRVGISIDGGAASHDENRKTVSGGNTHALVLKNYRKLKEIDPHCGAMATITNTIIDDPDGFYDFYRNEGIDVGFNACYYSPSGKEQFRPEAYGRFLCRLFDLWIGDPHKTMHIIPFERILRVMTNPGATMSVCQFIPDCREVNITTDAAGNIYQCLHYCNLQNGSIGNILHEPLETILSRNLSGPSHWDRMSRGQCGDCDIRRYCYGGCPYWSDAKSLTGLERDFSCLGQKMLVHHIHDVLDAWLKAHKKGPAGAGQEKRM